MTARILEIIEKRADICVISQSATSWTQKGKINQTSSFQLKHMNLGWIYRIFVDSSAEFQNKLACVSIGMRWEIFEWKFVVYLKCIGTTIEFEADSRSIQTENLQWALETNHSQQSQITWSKTRTELNISYFIISVGERFEWRIRVLDTNDPSAVFFHRTLCIFIGRLLIRWPYIMKYADTTRCRSEATNSLCLL